MVLSIDLETYSDIDLRTCGVYRYTESFEILLFAYAFDDEDVQIVDLACGEPLPERVISAIHDDDVIKSAWNASFERTCLSRYFGETLLPDSWQCTMVWAASLSLPLSLQKAAEALGVEEQKDSIGEKLIKFFSRSCKPTKVNGMRCRNLPVHDPAKWRAFKRYCMQDVRTERSVRHELERHPLPEQEWTYYHMDQRINDRGVLLDSRLIDQAIACDTELSRSYTDQAKKITGLDNPNSVLQLRGWLREHGVEVDSLDKKTVSKLLPTTDSDVQQVLWLRQQMSKSSVKKYIAAKRCICSDGRAHGLFQFSGATRTQRWAGRLIQLQNLPQNHISTLDEARWLVREGEYQTLEYLYDSVPVILSQLIRTMLIPREGHEFIVADFSAIEARVLAWLADETWRLDAFRAGEDIYCASASEMFHVPVIRHGENSELRQKGKIAELACGYGGAAGALTAMGAQEMGLTEEELYTTVEQWRNANPAIVAFWRRLERSAKAAIQKRKTYRVGRIRVLMEDEILWLELPSGRRLAYYTPTDSLTYSGQTMAGKWETLETYGGKLAENVTQATSRDLLAAAMLRMEERGLHIVGHVHDEVILEEPIGSVTVEEVCALMSEAPPWAEGLPLAAAGYKGTYYYKD